jgi:hypothetical protein
MAAVSRRLAMASSSSISRSSSARRTTDRNTPTKPSVASVSATEMANESTTSKARCSALSGRSASFARK